MFFFSLFIFFAFFRVSKQDFDVVLTNDNWNNVFNLRNGYTQDPFQCVTKSSSVRYFDKALRLHISNCTSSCRSLDFQSGNIFSRKTFKLPLYVGAWLKLPTELPGLLIVFELFGSGGQSFGISFFGSAANGFVTSVYRNGVERYAEWADMSVDPFNVGDGRAEFHEYGIAVSSARVSFYVDGNRIGRDEDANHISSNKRYEISLGVWTTSDLYPYTGAFNLSHFSRSDRELALQRIRQISNVDTYPGLDYKLVVNKTSSEKTGGRDFGISISYIGLFVGLICLMVCVTGVCLWILVTCVFYVMGFVNKDIAKRVSMHIPTTQVHDDLEMGNSSINNEYSAKNKNGGDMKKIDQLEEIDRATTMKTMANLKINKTLFSIEIDDLEFKKIIGRGGFSTVYLAWWRNTDVAFKSFDTAALFDSSNNFVEFESELSLVSSISHPNVPQFFGAVLKPPRVGIVMEFCSKGNIREYLEANPMLLGEKVRLLSEISNGMSFLHDLKIIHRDLKPENIMLNKQRRAKIIDFGLSKVTDQTEVNITQGVGTSFYMAPEVFLGEIYDEKADVFSFGIIIYAVIFNNFMPYGTDKTYVHGAVAKDPEFRPEIPTNHELLEEFEGEGLQWLFQLMQRCWSHTGECRPSFSNIFDFFVQKQRSVDEFEKRLSMAVSKPVSVPTPSPGANVKAKPVSIHSMGGRKILKVEEDEKRKKKRAPVLPTGARPPRPDKENYFKKLAKDDELMQMQQLKDQKRDVNVVKGEGDADGFVDSDIVLMSENGE